MKPGEVEEVRAKTLREQLGEGGGQDAPDAIVRKPRGPASATRTTRAGDGVRALAKAWDDATAPRKTAERRAKPGAPRHAERDSDAAPRRAASAKPTFGVKSRDEARAPRSSAEDRRPASKSAADRPTRRVTTTSRAEADTAPRRAATTKPAFGAKSRDTAPAPRSSAEDRRPASKSAADRPTRRVTTTSRAEGDTAPTPRRIAGPKSGVPKRAASPSRIEGDSATPSRRIAGPKPGYVKSGAKPTTKAPAKPTAKPPSKPRKG